MFSDTLYKQSDRGVMNSPLGLILTDIFPTTIESNVEYKIEQLLAGRWYIDDTFVVFDWEEQAQDMLKLSNDSH